MFFDFICDNWKWLSAALYATILFIILLIKKKVKVVDVVKTVIVESLPDAIKLAEKTFGSGHGDEKLSFVINLICEAIASKYGIDDLTVFKVYRPYIEQSVENILSTPTKK